MKRLVWGCDRMARCRVAMLSGIPWLTMEQNGPKHPQRAVAAKPLQTAGRMLARTFAVLAMVVQVVFYADHIGATAAKSFGNAPLDARFGFMEICTGNGVELVALDGTPIAPDHDCPICENASVLAFGEPVAISDPAFPFVAFMVVWDRSDRAHGAEMRFPGTKPIRAPPVLS